MADDVVIFCLQFPFPLFRPVTGLDRQAVTYRDLICGAVPVIRSSATSKIGEALVIVTIRTPLEAHCLSLHLVASS